MDYKVYPLAITQVSWQTFIQVCQETLGFSPTRGLDKQGLSVEKPSAFLACLDLENKPLDNLRNRLSLTFEHFSVSFIIKGNEKLLKQIAFLGTLHIVHKQQNDDFLIIVSGTMDKWYSTVLRACQEHRPKELRWVFNVIFAFFKDAGFGDVWHGKERKTLPDNTFVFVFR